MKNAAKICSMANTLSISDKNYDAKPGKSYQHNLQEKLAVKLEIG